MAEYVERELLDAKIMAIVKGSSEDVSARDVCDALMEDYGLSCPYYRVFRRMTALVKQHHLNSDKQTDPKGGYLIVFRMASA